MKTQISTTVLNRTLTLHILLSRTQGSNFTKKFLVTLGSKKYNKKKKKRKGERKNKRKSNKLTKKPPNKCKRQIHS